MLKRFITKSKIVAMVSNIYGNSTTTPFYLRGRKDLVSTKRMGASFTPCPLRLLFTNYLNNLWDLDAAEVIDSLLTYCHKKAVD